ncbi:MAG: DUF447 family protein [Planctomycetes bacterium]|nr:DUF447 family protein [Planctomycetota bacterium]
MIVEGLIITVDRTGQVNLAPLGPVVDEGQTHFLLRPFQGSKTLANLQETGVATFHIIDDVELTARAAINAIAEMPKLERVAGVEVPVLADTCRWFALRVVEIDASQARVEVRTEVTAQGALRDFWGFNRAKHAILEAAIAATRVKLLPGEEIVAEFRRLAPLVRKTGGTAEQRAWDLLANHVAGTLGVLPQELGSISAGRPRRVRVETGSRLHFGMFSFGQPNVPAFGGLGAMVSEPSVVVELTLADRLSAEGPLASVAEAALRRAQQAGWLADLPGCHAQIMETPRQHIGLGVGTQLALAVVAGGNALAGGPLRSAEELATVSGRAGRSSIGTLGFVSGGLLIEAGKPVDASRNATAIGQLVARVALPDDWRWILLTPREASGLSGDTERRAFETLPAVPEAVTNELVRLATLDIVPAAQRADVNTFNESLHRFSILAGNCFARHQQGVPFHAWTARWIAWLQQAGVRGGAQSSWGPTLALVAASETAARDLVDRLSIAKGEDVEVVIARPANRGALIAVDY